MLTPQLLVAPPLADSISGRETLKQKFSFKNTFSVKLENVKWQECHILIFNFSIFQLVWTLKLLWENLEFNKAKLPRAVTVQYEYKNLWKYFLVYLFCPLKMEWKQKCHYQYYLSLLCNNIILLLSLFICCMSTSCFPDWHEPGHPNEDYRWLLDTMEISLLLYPQNKVLFYSQLSSPNCTVLCCTVLYCTDLAR